MTTSETGSKPSTTQPSPSISAEDDLLAQVEDMAAALMPVREIAVLTGMSREETDAFVYAIKNGQESPIANAYRKGRLSTKLQLRKKVVSFAIKGSPAAQPLADGYLKENDCL